VRLEGSGARRPVSVPDPSLLVHLIGLPAMSGPLAVRAAFSSAEHGAESVAGDLVPGLFVDGGRPAALAAGLAGVWASVYRRPRGFRRDVIAHQMVRARVEGVAWAEEAYEDDLVQAADSVTQGLAARPVARELRLLPRLRRGERPTEGDPVLSRVQGLVRAVRRVFGPGDWTVEWADDGQRTWLLQIGPTRNPPTRTERFTAASHRDLLPAVPSRLMTSLIGSCASGLFEHYRRFDPGLPSGRPLLEIVDGRPLLNLTLLTDMVRRWGLPTRLVTGSIGGVPEREFGLSLPRLVRHAPVLGRLGVAQLRSVRSARDAEKEILERTNSPPTRLGEALDELCRVYGILAREMLSLTGAMSAPLALLRRAGVLAQLARGWSSTATEMRQSLESLRAQVAERPALLESLRRGEVPDDPVFSSAFEAWLERFGHRGFYVSDIARPRYREAPGPVLRSLAAPVTQPPPPRRSISALLLRPLAWPTVKALRARESLRSAAMVGFERLRRVLLARARDLVKDDVLPTPEALFDLDVDEVRRFDEGFRPDPGFWETRRQELEAHPAWNTPDVVRCGGENLPEPEEETPRTLPGLGLTAGRVEGRAWVAAEPGAEPPPDLDPQETILVAPAVDLGWILPFGRVAGVAVETGGDLSYGSIALREMGLPAVTNVRGLSRAVRTGDRLVLDAGAGTVERG
jgi:pyruvate,water dikinase